MRLSVVIPVYNERESLRALHREIEQTAQQNGFQLETVFVDDGSTDGSWIAIEQLAAQDDTIRAVRFRRNFGKSAALAAGIRASASDWIVTIDADLQDNIAELPKLVAKAESGLDVVSGWKIVRRDPLGKRIASKLFNWLVNRASGLALHDHNCGFKLFRRDVFDDLQLYGDWHRFIPVLAAGRGWRVGEVGVDHRPRQFGKSKYGWSRFLHGSLDLITIGFLSSPDHRPQRFLGTLGLFSTLFGLGGMLYLAFYWLLRMALYPEWTPVHDRPMLLYSLGALLVGVHMLALSFLAELLVAQRGDGRSHYSIAESIRTSNGVQTPAGGTANPPEAASGDSWTRVDRPAKSRTKRTL